MKLIFILIASLIILIIYYPWFVLTGTLSSGDWPYLFLENIKAFPNFSSNFLWLTPYYQISAKLLVEYLGFSWNFSERILWFWPYLIISLFSSWYLAKNILGKSKLIFLTPIIFLLNTYSLMLVGGGQMGIALSYAFAPFVLGYFMKNIDSVRNHNFKNSILMGIVLAVQGMFDIRIAYITVLGILIYFLISEVFFKKVSKKTLDSVFYFFILPISIAILLHLYWIIPFFFGSHNKFSDFGSMYNTVAATKFLSFASFSQTISLLHPNWPENFFGKTYFMMPEFILLPILAYSSLIFLKVDKKKIIFFSFLGLIGAFLAKGMNEPFGDIYSFLFNYVPGFVMFRDPTKWYLLVVLSYSILIPFSLSQIIQSIKITKIYIFPLVTIIFLLYWCFTIRFALLGQLGGTFKSHSLPEEYVELKNFVKSQNNYFPTLWIPATQRYGYSSKNNPAISGQDFFESSSLSAILQQLDDQNAREKIEKQKIKYIVVPFDSQKEIFITDRKYDFSLYLKTKNNLEKLSWLKPSANFGEILVFKVKF